MRRYAEFSFFGKTFLTGALLAAALMLAGAPQLHAQDCQRRIIRADHELHKAALRHGWDSPQATERRRELFAAREWCWKHGHRWWDEDNRRWHAERDWDEHDHDHPPR
ncbi:MAG: hypothetical protein WA789_06205 [Candidatus Acidiferrum sp.]